MTDWVIRTVHFEHKVLEWANKRVNEPKPLTWAVDFMVSEDFLIIFMSLWEQIYAVVVVANLNSRGMVGRIYVVNHYANATY